MRRLFFVVSLCLAISAQAEDSLDQRQSVQDALALNSPGEIQVDEQAINAAMVDAFMAMPSQRNADDREAAVQRVAELYLLAEQAQRQGLAEQPEHQAGLALAEINYLATAVLQQLLAEVDVSESALKALQARNVAAVGDFEYRLSWILLDDKGKAEALLNELDGLEGFGLAARQHSIDTATAEYGGELGWVQRTALAEAVSSAVQSLSPGEIYPEPVAVEANWALLFLRDRRDFEVPDFDSIRLGLVSQARREAVTDLVNRLRKQASLPPRN
jgi:peptidyl-prolyl cis-trans isomerase C